MTGPEALRAQLIEVARRARDAGLQRSWGGNLSCRVPGSGTFLVKASGASFADLGPGDIVEVDSEGRVLVGEGRPTKEIRFHLGIYHGRPDAGAVVHVHPPWSIAAARIAPELPLVTDHARTALKRVPVVPPAASGSPELARHVTSAFEDPQVAAVLLREHGLVCIGPDPGTAELLAELVEETAQAAVLTRLLELLCDGAPRV